MAATKPVICYSAAPTGCVDDDGCVERGSCEFAPLPGLRQPPRELTPGRIDAIQALLSDTLLKRSFPTLHGVEAWGWRALLHGVEAWEWRALLDAARKGIKQ